MSDVITFGCRLNLYESEVIKSAIVGRDNLAVFNTCAVTKEAERQAKQAIRRYAKNNPLAEIVVTGCGAQIAPESYAAIPGVHKVLGNEEKMRPESYGSDKDAFGLEKIRVNDIMSVTETASHLVSGFEGRARAFVQVQNGCNHRCTFCIIPYGRGNSRSVPVGEIVREVRGLVEGGYNEIVLTGVDISDYGKDLPGAPTLGGMIRRLFALVPELPRLRLSSIDVAEIDADLLRLIAEEPRLMPHLHLSLQSGDDMILKRMKRRHSRVDILDFVAKARDLRPDMVFGADIIAGFPTETDDMFANTLNIVAEAGITWLHIFPYSEREGTPAAKIPNQVPKPLRKERAAQLRAAGEREIAKLLPSYIGTTQTVIVEKDNLGRTEHFAQVRLAGVHEAGSLISVEIASVEGAMLIS